MPKQPEPDLELNRLVRQSPLQPNPRTPTPSSPSSVPDLPNVPSYPRLPPIGLTREGSGLSNPGFQADEDPSSARPSGEPAALVGVPVPRNPVPLCGCAVPCCAVPCPVV